MPRPGPRKRLSSPRRCLLPLLLCVSVAVAACDDKALPVGGGGGMGGAAPWAGAGGATDLGTGGAGGAGATGASSAGGGGGASVEVACAGDLALRLSAVPLRPLDAFAYRNTMQSLLGALPSGEELPRDQAPEETEDDALARNVAAYHRLAHDQALAISQDPQALASLLGCDPSSQGEALCQQRLLDGFVAQAFRRPLAADEVDEFKSVFTKGRTLGGSFASGVRAVVEVALQSPEVLYRVEWGERARPDVAGIGRPTPFEMASRLSYLIWGGPPDGVLWAAAAQGGLRERADVGAQARRLLADPRAREGARHFLFQWLDVPEPGAASSALTRAFHDETRAFIDAVLWQGGDGTLATLLTARWSYLDAGLASFYGIADVANTDLQRVALSTLQRGGLFTQGSFLSTHPTSRQRGLHVWQQLLCDDTKDGEPLGLAFGHYDATGAWQDTDAGRTIDSSVVLTSTDAAGSYDGAPSLLRRLADSRDVQSCHVRKWMEFAYGRTVEAADACSTATLAKAFAGSGGNLPELFWQLTQTEAFLARSVP